VGVEVYHCVNDENNENAGFYCYFLYIRLIVEDDEVHIEEAEEEYQPTPQPARLYRKEQVVELSQLWRVAHGPRLQAAECVHHM
jgi:hypothetical protein